ncbi:MAG: sigma 54-interacting transcriptional regulator [Pseudomonadota bacterium]
MSDPENTFTFPTPTSAPASAALLGLTVLWHPDWQRAGEQCIGPAAGASIELSRFAGLFGVAGGAPRPLGHRSISRAPLLLQRDGARGLMLVPPASNMALELNGSALHGPLALSEEQLDAGAVLCLGGSILLCLHWMRHLPRMGAVPGLLGVSGAVQALRSEIMQAAGTDLPVLLLGETGTGKEVAARAIHAASARAAGPLVTLNMATLQEGLAAADLFGASKGAYTGAVDARPGLFAEAAGGTLFLDEIGNTPAAVQPMLLRVLENGEFRPLGASRAQQSRARLIAATDVALDADARLDTPFNQPLLRRLEGFVIRLPPLRERREDIGLLVAHFAAAHLARPALPPLPPELVHAWCRHDWPGNVRQLGNVVRRALIALLAGAPVDGAGLLPAARPVRQVPSPARPVLANFSEHDVLQAMEQNGWRIRAAALALGISRPSMYKLLAVHSQVRAVEDIPREEIALALQRHGADLQRSAAQLKTPSEALRRHVRQWGLAPRQAC